MTPQALEEFTKSPAPGFRCYAARDKSDARFVASVQHILNPPASSASIAQIRQMLDSHAGKVAEFYQHHDGFVLYRDTKSDAAGIELLSVEQWEQATNDMRDWFGHL